MPGHHSRIKNQDYKIIGNTAILTFYTNFSGPITCINNEDLADAIKNCPTMDIIEEAIYYFKPNVFLKNFEIKSPIDRLFIYLTLYILECLKLIKKSCVTKEQAKVLLNNFSKKNVYLPGDPNFNLNFMFKNPNSKEEIDFFRNYLIQIRKECGLRIVNYVFYDEKSKPSKWWLCFSNRKFLNLSLYS